MRRNLSNFSSEDDVAMTCAPAALANCKANSDTAPAPWVSTMWKKRAHHVVSNLEVPHLLTHRYDFPGSVGHRHATVSALKLAEHDQVVVEIQRAGSDPHYQFTRSGRGYGAVAQDSPDRLERHGAEAGVTNLSRMRRTYARQPGGAGVGKVTFQGPDNPPLAERHPAGDGIRGTCCTGFFLGLAGAGEGNFQAARASKPC